MAEHTRADDAKTPAKRKQRPAAKRTLEPAPAAPAPKGKKFSLLAAMAGFLTLLMVIAWLSSAGGKASVKSAAGVTADGSADGTADGTAKGTASDATCAADGTCEASKKRRKKKLKAQIHPEYERLIEEYPFQPVRNERGEFVNIILVRSPFRAQEHYDDFLRLKDDILFLGMCSFEDFPLPSRNPYSMPFPKDFYVGMFPGFLHMFKNPEEIFPKHVKLLLMSQSDFALPYPEPPLEKIYDFTFSGSDQDVHSNCKGWSSFAKNWTFVKEALKVMCGEYKMTGVLVATKDKADKKACTIPKVCKKNIIQTKYLPQEEYFHYLAQSRFAFIPQIHDASPRVTTQALKHDVPLLMNKNIVGGWKYVNNKTGEFFNDMSDFRTSLERIMSNLEQYTPREYVEEHYGDFHAGIRFKTFIEEHFRDRVKLPKGTRILMPTGA